MQAWNEWSNILLQSSQVRKKPPLPPCVFQFSTHIFRPFSVDCQFSVLTCSFSLICLFFLSSVFLQCYCQFALCWRIPTQMTPWCPTLHASTRPMWQSSTRMQRTGQQNMPCNNVERGLRHPAALGGDWERSSTLTLAHSSANMWTHCFFFFFSVSFSSFLMWPGQLGSTVCKRGW